MCALHRLPWSMTHGAAQGLRTLMLATRVLGAQQWQAWNRLYQAAASSLDAREKKIAQVSQVAQGCLVLASQGSCRRPFSTGKQRSSYAPMLRTRPEREGHATFLRLNFGALEEVSPHLLCP